MSEGPLANPLVTDPVSFYLFWEAQWLNCFLLFVLLGTEYCS